MHASRAACQQACQRASMPRRNEAEPAAERAACWPPASWSSRPAKTSIARATTWRCVWRTPASA